MTTQANAPRPRYTLVEMPLSAPILSTNQRSFSTPIPRPSQRTPSAGDRLATNKLLEFVRSSSPARSALAFGAHTLRTSSSSPHPRRLSKASTISSTSTITEPIYDLGGLSHPILHFRPNLWRHLDCDRETLNLDLFWPNKPSQSYSDFDDAFAEPTIFPPAELAPLHSFHYLRSLHLNGMMRSYQRQIWVTVWMNPNLSDLSLEMALEPLLAPNIAHQRFTKIDQVWARKWQQKNDKECPSAREAELQALLPAIAEYEYLGAHGQGILHDEFGDGEYLDRQTIALARLDAALVSHLDLNTSKYLPITKLTLLGFVVDSGPFTRLPHARSHPFFDPARLRQIIFKDHCIDAGFALPASMGRTCDVGWAGAGSARSVEAGSVKMVRVQKIKTAKELGAGLGERPEAYRYNKRVVQAG